MIKTATNIIKGVFRQRKEVKQNFQRINWLREKLVKHGDDQTIKQLDFDTFSVRYKRPYEFLHAYTEIFEREIYRFETATKAPLIIDCGSNIGMSVLYFKKLFTASTIVAFEPDPVNFELLQQNVVLNHLQNVQLHQAAVWIADGSISFSAHESEASHISMQPADAVVKAVRLQLFLQQYPTIDFLKIDIEGAEFEVIRDCQHHLKNINHLFLEYHGKSGETDKLYELLHIVYQAGFHVYIRNAADMLKHPFIEKQTGTQYDVQLNLFCYQIKS